MNINRDWSSLRKLMFLRGSTGGGGSPLTVTGATPLLMPGAVSKPMRAASFAISPVQAGSGDPSPSNVRPITGWTGCTAWVTGKNLFDINATFANPSDTTFSNQTKRVFQPFTYCAGLAYSNYFSHSNVSAYSVSNGTLTVENTNVYGVAFPVPIGAGMTVTVNATVTGDGRMDVSHFQSDGTFISGTQNKLGIAITPPSGCAMTVFIFYAVQTDSASFSDICITPGTTATPYTPYSGSSLSVEFPASVGTVYSGTIDPVTGEGAVTHKYALLNDPDKWETTSGTLNYLYNIKFDDRKLFNNSFDGLTATCAPIVSKARYTGRWNGALQMYFGFYDADGIWTLEAVKQAATENKIAILYELATPIPFTIPPQSLTPPAGDAYIWADCGSTAEVTYIGKP